MRISHRHKFIYFSNPRSASESVRTALDEYSDIQSTVSDSIYHNHVTPVQLRPHFDQQGWDWGEYYKFTFVRNPWDRLVSFYHYFKPDKNRELVWVRGEWTRENALPFDDFVRSLIDTVYPCLHQTDFTLDEAGRPAVDFVGKVENIRNDFQSVCRAIGIRASLPWGNRTRRRTYQVYYNRETAGIVAAVFQQEIETFGYRFKPLGFLENVVQRMLRQMDRIGRPGRQT